MKNLIIIVFVIVMFPAKAQELFIHAEPASNIPKSVIGIRAESNHYDEFGTSRNWAGFSVMYGISPKLMTILSASASNHHDSKLPPELFSSDGSNGQVHSHNTIRGREYDMKFEGLHLYAKYRAITIDGPKRHLRIALFGEASMVQTPHDEAEPDLHGDNSGFGGGIIMTQLINKFAYSTSLSYIKPLPYNDKSTNSVFTSGEAWSWSLSLGYQLFPFKLKNYKQPGINVYCEFVGKDYSEATLKQNDVDVDVTGANSLLSGNFMDVRPGVQIILNSNTRFDFSMAWLVAGKSYARTYPEAFIKIQHYFYLGK